MTETAPKYFSSADEEKRWKEHLAAIAELPHEPELDAKEDDEEEFFVL
jgi:hypothetical protein